VQYFRGKSVLVPVIERQIQRLLRRVSKEDGPVLLYQREERFLCDRSRLPILALLEAEVVRRIRGRLGQASRLHRNSGRCVAAGCRDSGLKRKQYGSKP